MLAAAVDVARRRSLDPPVPITFRYRVGGATDETSWQRSVLDHLGVDDWVVVDVDDEMDFVGPVAAEVMRRHGLLLPPQAHALLPLATRASGGTLLTGEWGDWVFQGWRWQHLAGMVLAGRPSRRGLRQAALAVAPRPARRLAQRRKQRPPSWLRPDVRARVAASLADEAADDPLHFGRWLTRWRSSRLVRVVAAAHATVVEGEGARLVTPFLDPGFLDSLAAWGGRWSRGDRTAVMVRLFDDVLPPPVLSRVSKAEFSGAFWAGATRRFVERWDGRISNPYVDVDALAAEWRRPVPHAAAAGALKQAWMEHEGLDPLLGDRTGTAPA